jgi:bifunctional UDP-N-acetylglucosamine pyrophosphorylase/glucosamine-1-phosphate N-acetyltransferase
VQTVVLAAGRGRRMERLTDDIPKPMLTIKGKPILEYKIKLLPREIEEVIFVVGYKKSQIERYFGKNFDGRKITYVLQKDLNGTGGAVHLVKDLVEDRFLVMMGDDLYHRSDVEKIINQNSLAILSAETDNPERFGVFDIDENGNLLDILEKPENPPTNLINTGLYLLDKKFFDYELVKINKKEYGLPQTLVKVAKDYPVKILKSRAWQPIGNPEELKKAEEVLGEFV